jgi:hypothetical protein
MTSDFYRYFMEQDEIYCDRRYYEWISQAIYESKIANGTYKKGWSLWEILNR